MKLCSRTVSISSVVLSATTSLIYDIWYFYLTAECPECDKKFSRVASLKAHLMVHERDESIICPECGDEFGVQVNQYTYLFRSRGNFPSLSGMTFIIAPLTD